MNQYIIVNATALDRSGALSILRQFVENIPVDGRKWIVFVSDKVNVVSENPDVCVEPISGVKPMYKRLLWDVIGLDRWLKKHHMTPIACISLQNTGFRVSKRNLPNFIYYHQPLPFFKFKWNPLKKKERILWFYKNIYPFFVKLFLRKDTVVFTQLNFIKNGFVKRFGHSTHNVEIYSPSVAEVADDKNLPISIANTINLFYPATAHFYKNHKVLYNALKKFDGEVHLYVTIPCVEENVTSTGVITFSQVCTMYRQCDALVFPSYVETFGLPLLEAAQTGMPIIAADLPYSREVLDGYEGVTFVKYDDPDAWAKAIANLKKGQRFTPIDISNRPGWEKLFESISTHINNNNL